MRLISIIAIGFILSSCQDTNPVSTQSDATETAEVTENEDFIVSSDSTTDGNGEFSLAWKGIKNAKEYSIKIAEDEACETNVQVDITTTDSNIKVKLSGSGKRYVCIVAIDRNGRSHRPKIQPTIDLGNNDGDDDDNGSQADRSGSNGSSGSSSNSSNAAPTITMVEPGGNNDSVATNGTFNITYTPADSDNNAMVSLYYKNAATGACSTGTLIVANLAEDTVSSYSWDTTGIAAGTYYVCGSIDDSVNDAVEDWSDALVIDAAPTITMGEPTGSDDEVAENGSFTVTYTPGDSDSNALVSLYYKGAATGVCSSGTLIVANLAENTVSSHNWDTTGIAAGSYYVCASISDSVNDAVEDWSDAALDINDAPTIAIAEPTGGDDSANAGDSFSITWTDADADNDATISLYYKVGSGSGACSTGTLIATGISEDSGTDSYSWDTTGLSTGNYYVCGNINDSVNSAVESWSSSYLAITAAAAPSITLTAPAGTDDIVEVGSTTSITWTDDDTDSDASISLYYSTSNSGPCSSTGTLITSGISEDSATDSYTWDTTGVDDGYYYICASITDGTTTVEDYSDLIGVYPTTYCGWTGQTDTDWETAANWTNCSGIYPSGTSTRVVILARAPNMPLVSNDITIRAFDGGVGGGTVTIAAGATLSVNNNNSYLSSVTLQGATTTCTTCVVLNINNAKIQSGATLTLLKGISFRFKTAKILNVGDSGKLTTGHLVVNGGATEAEWPIIEGETSSATWNGIYAYGVDSSNLSSVSVSGLKMRHLNMAKPYFTFKSDFNFSTFENVDLGDDSSSWSDRKAESMLRFDDCSDSSIASTWTSITFGFRYNRNEYRSLDVDTGTCNAAAGFGVTITGDGNGFGDHLDTVADFFTFTDGGAYACDWDGSESTSWIDADNWSNCNSRYPTINDTVAIDSGAANQPTVPSGVYYINQFHDTVSDGGTITLASGANLVMANDFIYSDVNLQGDAATCTDCSFSKFYDKVTISGATLGLGEGLDFYFGYDLNANRNINVGYSEISGHLKTTQAANANSSYWPRIKAMSGTHRGFVINGATSANVSTVDIDGLTIEDIRYVNDAFFFNTEFDVLKFDNISMDTEVTADDFEGAYISMSSCTDGTFTDTSFDNIIFVDGVSTGYNYEESNANCDGVLSTSFTGSGNGYGAANEFDRSTDDITWN